ncbi:MAG: serine/threonine protein kinase, partial [Myxococcales bacterium]|nr:serine/threonine protein kinase [Myxococcales bacterium]
MTSDPPIADRYVLGEPIGRGGMGQVYRAWDTVLDKAVAVKLLADRSPSGEALERFRREAAASARLGHEHIVVTHDVVPLPGGSIALVMELVEGPSLREWLHERGPFDPATVIELARQLADGLAAVHRIGIVHRDLKPANVMVDRGPGGPRLKIADFGIASLPETAQLTRAGTVLGTPEYMAPERFRGAAPTPAMDVYALGVI